MPYTLVKATSRPRRRRNSSGRARGYRRKARRNVPLQIRRSRRTGRFSGSKRAKFVTRFPRPRRKARSSRVHRRGRRRSRPSMAGLAGLLSLAKKPRRSNPGRRRRSKSRSRLSNPGTRHHRRRRSSHRSNPGHKRKLRVPMRRPERRLTDGIRELLGLDTWLQAGVGAGGLSFSLIVPSKLAELSGQEWLHRGLGGVATATITSGLASGIIALASPRMGKAFLVGSAIGVFIRAVGAWAPDAVKKYLPIEDAVLAASLPTLAKGGAAGNAQMALQNAIRSGDAATVARLLGPGAMTGMGRTMDQVAKAEHNYRKQLGLGGYVNEAPLRAGRPGMKDYVNFAGPSQPRMPTGPEQF